MMLTVRPCKFSLRDLSGRREVLICLMLHISREHAMEVPTAKLQEDERGVGCVQSHGLTGDQRSCRGIVALQIMMARQLPD